MAENIQKVKVVSSKINQRATVVRSELTKYVTMIKCGTPAEIDEARHQFDRAVIEFKKTAILEM